MGVLASGIWRDDRLGSARREPVAQAPGVVGSVGDEAHRARHDRQQGACAGEAVDVAGGEFEGARPAALVRQGVDFRRAAAARTPDGVAEGPPFAPAAERCALMCVESIAAVPIIPVEPVRA
jgi:hypothetical protein